MIHLQNKNCARAFTLIEMMVSIALFSIVMVTVAAAYLNLLNLDRQARATNDVADNLNFVVDTMTRSIRTGTNYACGGPNGTNCAYPNPLTVFQFIDDQGNTDTYILDTTNHQIGECPAQTGTCTVGAGTYQAITDPRVLVDTLAFYVHGVDTGNSDSTQPQVTIVMHGTISVKANNSNTPTVIPFDIESSATQRQIDL